MARRVSIYLRDQDSDIINALERVEPRDRSHWVREQIRRGMGETVSLQQKLMQFLDSLQTASESRQSGERNVVAEENALRMIEDM